MDEGQDIGVAYWHKIENVTLCSCGPEANWSALGSACSKHDEWRVSGRVVGGNSLGAVHKLNRSSLYCYVLANNPSSLGFCPGEVRSHAPVAVFGQFPVRISDESQVLRFMSGNRNLRVYVDFSNKNEAKIVLDENALLSWMFYFPTYRYLGIAKINQSKLPEQTFLTDAGTRMPRFDGVDGAICLMVDNKDPSSHKSITLVLVAAILSGASSLVALGFLQIQPNAWQAFFVYVVFLLVCFTMHLWINGLLEASELFI